MGTLPPLTRFMLTPERTRQLIEGRRSVGVAEKG
jgi:hypothetical protein